MNDYKLTPHGSVIRLSDGASIPPDPANTDYAAYLAWVAAGGIADPVDPPTADEINSPILSQIAELDTKRVRPAAEISEALATGDAPDAGSVARLVELNERIAALRSQLTK